VRVTGDVIDVFLGADSDAGRARSLTDRSSSDYARPTG
jgi:hypothetical protein